MEWSIPSIRERPHQPITFHFPQRKFCQKAVTKHSFQAKWFSKWPWLHYNEENDNIKSFTNPTNTYHNLLTVWNMVVLSTIMVKKGAVHIAVAISWSTWKAKSFIVSFWIWGEVTYISLFFLIESRILGSSSSRSFSSCKKLESEPSPEPQNGRPCLDKT